MNDSPTFTVRLKIGIDETKIPGGIEAAAPIIIAKLTQDLKNSILDEIRKPPKTGRVYHLKNPTRTHQASAPGQSPATDLGGLVGSVGITPGTPPLVGEIFVAAAYASHLEYGTKRKAGGWRMEPRPYVLPAIRGFTARLQGNR